MMEFSRCLQAFLLLAFLLNAGDCANASITVSPQILTLSADTGQVNITCTGELAANENLKQITIIKKFHGNTSKKHLVKATADGHNSGAAQLMLPIPGASVSGSFQDVQISLNLSQATCHDAGQYICAVSYQTPSANRSKQKAHNLYVEVSPKPFTVTVSPRGKTRWTVGDVLKMRCQGFLGSVKPNTQVSWVWEYRDTFTDNSSWQPYDGDDSDVETSRIVDSGQCYHIVDSTLTRHLKEEDSGRLYRCYVRQDTKPLIQIAATHPVGAVWSAGRTESIPRTNGYFGIGVTGIVALAFGVIGTLSVIMWMWRRHWVLPCAGSDKKSLEASLLLPGQGGSSSYGDYLEPIAVLHTPEQEERLY